MSENEIILRLHDLGWLQGWPRDAAAIPVAVVAAAKAGYAQFHGVPVDQIEPHMGLPRCALPDKMQLGMELNKWANPDVTWAVKDELPGLTRQQFVDCVVRAMKSWSDVCGIKPRMVTGDRADIIITVGRIDGPGQTLAWSNLPPTNPVVQKYDSGERVWTIDVPAGSGAIGAENVVAHELGHGLIGCGHLSGGPNLMNPTYNPRIHKPQAGDIAEGRSRYGPPSTQPGPTPGPTPTPGGPMFDWITLFKLAWPFIKQLVDKWIASNSTAPFGQWLTAEIKLAQAGTPTPGLEFLKALNVP